MTERKAKEPERITTTVEPDCREATIALRKFLHDDGAVVRPMYACEDHAPGACEYVAVESCGEHVGYGATPAMAVQRAKDFLAGELTQPKLFNREEAVT